MAFQRAQWHSGLTYQQICDQCRTIIQYKDDKLDFRPWFADGFVYCPKCKKPLRHKEEYAIDRPEAPQDIVVEAIDAREKFCSHCGREFREEDNFCSNCGKKRN